MVTVRPADASASRFHEIAGWVADAASRTADVLGATVPEVRYRRRPTGDGRPSATPAGTG
jgi:hypothetical protein